MKRAFDLILDVLAIIGIMIGVLTFTGIWWLALLAGCVAALCLYVGHTIRVLMAVMRELP